MVGKLEWIAGIVRVGPTDGEFDPYQFVVTVVRKGNTANLIGASGTFSRSVYMAVFKVLSENGIEVVTWEKKNNSPRDIEHKTKPGETV